jgi:NADH dehydrogenase FAD-containing subunit
MHVVICGGGFAGLTLAKKLARKCEVTLIDKKPAFEYVPSLPFVVSKKKSRLDLIINYNEFGFKNAINVIHDRIIQIDHVNKTIVCEKQQVKFDKCVVHSAA